ncbi:serine/threonine-protein phosphatase 7 long form homolog [Panicum virgatum]|uniref:serine/threonine-protein phosphatase 7 long form homolog n=1 Tax=Panicum virgatum TaxID=38727 RepID=UPI0019D57E5C|nr:serine/threonine-protein phosphatase 7 long form homolog [Panicum virgatum]
MWERIPIGRPERHSIGVVPSYEEEAVGTVGWLWNNSETMHGNPGRRYVDYSNALDCLSAAHVEWQPYNREEVQNMELSPQCTMDTQYWRSVCPLICYYIVEFHLPNRVMRQFGILQTCPPEHLSTSQELHAIDRRKQRGMKNWEEKHVAHVNAWNLRANNIVFGGPVHRDSQFKTYLEWLKQQTRLKLKVAMDATNIEDFPSDPEDVFDEYDARTRMA